MRLREHLRRWWGYLVIGFTNPGPPPLPRTTATGCECQERINAITWARDRAVERLRTMERELEKVQAAYERLIVYSPACCIECDRENRAALPFPDNLTGSRMIVCSTCGNKRCPRATSHYHACTGSNASGQTGSVFA